jgi:hypothetical protein
MRDVRRLGGVAALVEAVFFLLVPVAFFLIFPRLGLATADVGDPAKLLAFSVKSPAIILFDVAQVIAAIAIVGLAVVLQDHLRASGPMVMRGAIIAASIGAALLVGSGVADIYDLVGLAQVYGHNPTMATTAYAGVGTMAAGMVWAGVMAFGFWVLSVSWLALQSRAFSPALNYIGIVWGVLAILSVFAVATPMLFMLSLLAPIVGVVWAGWLAMSLLQVKMPVGVGVGAARGRRSEPPATPAN